MSDPISLKDQSRVAWHATTATPSTDQLCLGALQRIADASEAMAKSHMALIADRDWWKDRADAYSKRMDRADRTAAALRGQITKLKKAKAA